MKNKSTKNKKLSVFEIVGLAIISIICLILYWNGAKVQLNKVNTDMKSTDQLAYMRFSYMMKESGYEFLSDGARMPLYVFIQSFIIEDDQMTVDDFFYKGKMLNLKLSVLLLIGFTFLFSRKLSVFNSIILSLIITFTIFIFKAGYFQPELLYFFLNFCVFLLLLKLFSYRSWKLALLTGVIAALAHLTKASILPGLILFSTIQVIREICIFYKTYKEKNQKNVFSGKLLIIRDVFLVILIYLVFLSPYLHSMKKKFGHYFYNVNTTFYMWYDSWEEVKSGTRMYGDREGWPQMPEQELPTMSKYLREHSLGQILHRIGNGVNTTIMNAYNSYGYFKYLIMYTIVLVLVIFNYREKFMDLLNQNIWRNIFLILYFLSYIVMIAWHVPISDGNRFFLAIYIPLLYVFLLCIQKILHDQKIKLFQTRYSLQNLLNTLVVLILIFDIYFVLTNRIMTVYGGK